MVKKIVHDPLFLAQKSVDATEADNRRRKKIESYRKLCRVLI